MKKLFWKSFILGFLFIHPFGFSANLVPSFDFENTDTLPKGVRNPRLKSLFFTAEEKFNSQNIRTPLGAKLNKKVLWSDVLESQKTGNDKKLLTGKLGHLKMSLSDSPGSTVGAVHTGFQVMVPVFAYGVTDRITLAAALPIYNIQISADTGFRRSKDGEVFLKNLARSPNPVKANEASRKLNNAIQEKLSRLNYEPIQSDEISGIGDFKLVAKARVFESEKFKVAIKPSLTAPTGIEPNAKKALDIATGDGQWDAGLGVVLDAPVTSNLNLHFFSEYVAQFADQIERRIPESSTDSLSKDQELVSRDLGDQFQFLGAWTYGKASNGFSFGSGISSQFLLPTEFQGKKFTAERYQFLESESPYQALHTFLFKAQFATIDWYKEKKFFYPFQANVTYSVPFAGANALAAPLLAAEMVLFF